MAEQSRGKLQDTRINKHATMITCQLYARMIFEDTAALQIASKTVVGIIIYNSVQSKVYTWPSAI